jgi:hypothetical protein
MPPQDNIWKTTMQAASGKTGKNTRRDTAVGKPVIKCCRKKGRGDNIYSLSQQQTILLIGLDTQKINRRL